MKFIKLVGPTGMFFIMFLLALSIKSEAFKSITN